MNQLGCVAFALLLTGAPKIYGQCPLSKVKSDFDSYKTLKTHFFHFHFRQSIDVIRRRMAWTFIATRWTRMWIFKSSEQPNHWRIACPKWQVVWIFWDFYFSCFVFSLFILLFWFQERSRGWLCYFINTESYSLEKYTIAVKIVEISRKISCHQKYFGWI